MSDPLIPVAIVFFSALALLVAYDVYRYLRYGIPGTISHWFWIKGQKYPILPFGIGFMLGAIIFGLAVHFWTP